MISKLIIISSPSGAGKTTLCKLLLKKMKNITLSISYTSRNKRLNEINGRDYFFVSEKNFLKLKDRSFFIETAKNFNNYYGSPYKNITQAKKNNNYCYLIQIGKEQEKLEAIDKNDIIDFFILPPSKSELKKRLVKRGRDNPKEIDLRLSYAIKEMKHYTEYKYVLINKNIHETVNIIKKYIEFDAINHKNKINLDKNLKRIIYS